MIKFIQKHCFILLLLLLIGNILQSNAQNAWENQKLDNSTSNITAPIHPMLKIKGPYQPVDESLSKHKQPSWFTSDKVGISMHWGVYAVPGWSPVNDTPGGTSYSEWYWMHMKDPQIAEYHKKQFGEKTYDELINLFKTENFNADEWIRNLKENGVKYFFITSKHHDGFCLWNTKYTDRNSAKMGPKRDLLEELGKACRKYGLKYGFYYSLYEWFNPLYLRDHDPKNKEKYDKMISDGVYTGLIEHKNYVDNFMIPQLVELTEKFNPDFLYFDGEWDEPESFWKMRQFVAWYYNRAAARGQEVMVNDRWGRGLRGKVGDLVHVEYQYGAELRGGTKLWAEWRGFGYSFGYNRNEKHYLTPEEAIRTVANCASGNGNVEFNIGPTADGHIPAPDFALLNAVGTWLKINGAAVYGASPNPIEKPSWGNISWQPAKKKLYLHVYDWPKNREIKLLGLKNKLKKAKLLADPKTKIHFTTEDNSLVLKGLPINSPDKAVTVIELTYAGEL